jgi:hypothetical protein
VERLVAAHRETTERAGDWYRFSGALLPPDDWLLFVLERGGQQEAILSEAVDTARRYQLFVALLLGLGFSTFLLATGISAIRHGALPGWLGWSAIVLGIATLAPAEFVAIPVGLVWVLVASVLLTMRTPAGQGS